jgi:hypothetical protein
MTLQDIAKSKDLVTKLAKSATFIVADFLDKADRSCVFTAWVTSSIGILGENAHK